MIELGLARISRLLQTTRLPWRAIHVAGTNGKGSVCAYVSAMLAAAKVRCGRFTSPHLMDRWDCITIDEKTVDERIFYEVEASVIAKDKREGIKASEFELLTATAFEIFAREKIEIGVVEVGLGGRYDATNILPHPLVSVITQIGKDHEAFLGETLEEITYQKAGIMKKGVPCVLDATNPSAVLHMLEDIASKIEAGPLFRVAHDREYSWIWDILPKEDYAAHQQINLYLAVQAVRCAIQRTYPLIDISRLLKMIPKTVWPGRLQNLSIEAITGRKRDILLDGAHNVQSAEVLRAYVDSKIRQSCSPVTWVFAFSKGKPIPELLSILVRTEDTLLATKFGPVDGMPWVQPADPDEILRAVRTLGIETQLYATGSINEALQRATGLSKDGPIVVAGSLYQVSDIMRLLRKLGNN